MKIKLAASFLCLLITFLAASCGGSSKHHAKHVSAEEVNIALDKQTFALASLKCISAERNGTGIPEYGEKLIHDVYELIETYRDHSTVIYDGKSMRTVLAESAESLEGCYRKYAQQIRNVLTYG
jgi:hypothetical protein